MLALSSKYSLRHFIYFSHICLYLRLGVLFTFISIQNKYYKNYQIIIPGTSKKFNHHKPAQSAHNS